MKDIQPQTFEDFIGNEHAVAQIKLLSTDAASGGKLPHMGFFGPPGCGKTTMSEIIARNTGRESVVINSVAVSSPMAFRGMITHPDNNKNGAVILLDECHRLSPSIQDNLLSLLEYPAVLVTSHRGEITRDKLPDHISFILATTHAGRLRDALLSRLEVVEFHEYSDTEKEIIAQKYIERCYHVKYDGAVLNEIARRSRDVRQIIRAVDNMVRLMRMKGTDLLTKDIASYVYKIFNIDVNGLTKRDRQLLNFIAGHDTVGLDTLEAYMGTPKKDIKDKIEPWLLRRGLIRRHASGRSITPSGMLALKGEIVNDERRSTKTV